MQNNTPTILIVEDELSIQKILEFELKNAGFNTLTAADGEAGLQLAREHQPDVIILDVMLPKMDGFSVCRELRKIQIDSYILMLSARDDEFYKIQGLDGGADDYMTKPFSSKELVSKVKAMLRRKSPDNNQNEARKKNQLVYGNMVAHLDTFKVQVGDDFIDFTLKEFELLTFLLKNKGRAMSRNVLLDELWGISFMGETRVVDVHVFKVRDKLKPYGIQIKTVRGVGYMLEELE